MRVTDKDTREQLRMRGNNKMTKTIKRLISVLIMTAMVMMIGMTSLAADTFSITIERPANDTAKHTYEAYQIFTGNLSNDKKLINLAAGSNLDLGTLKTQLGLDSSATLEDVVTKLNADTNPAAKVLASKTGDPVKSATSGTSAVTTITGVPGPGYYLITDKIDKTGSNPDLHGAVSAYMLQVVGKTTTLELKSKTDVPSLNKVIDKGSGVAANSVSIGDTVPFKLTSKVPDMSRYNRYWFKVTDTLCKGFDFNNDVEITIGGNPLTAGDDYTVTATGKTNIEIVFKDFKQYTKDNDIVITYSAVLNKDEDRTTTGNDNKARLTFSNDPNYTYDGDEPNNDNVTGKTPEIITKTYTTGVAVQKVDGNNKALAGASFKITGSAVNKVVTVETTYTLGTTSDPGEYYKLKDGTYTTKAPTSATEDDYESTTDKYNLTTTESVNDASGSGTDKTVTVTVDDNGYVSFEGLGPGKYTIEETDAPAGYQKSDAKIMFEITSTPTLSSPGWAIASQTGTTAGTEIVASDVNASGPILYQFKIKNEKENDLPITGGMGTAVFYGAGSILMLAGVTLLISKKKRTEANR